MRPHKAVQRDWTRVVRRMIQGSWKRTAQRRQITSGTEAAFRSPRLHPCTCAAVQMVWAMLCHMASLAGQWTLRHLLR